MLQWVIDTIGKLGPFAVAFAVFAVNLRQNRWSNTLARRSAEVEDQKFRLALIDRRGTALEALREAYSEWTFNGRVTPRLSENLVAALRVAELVFDDEHELAITAVYRDALKWQQLDRQVERWTDRDEERRQAALQGQFEMEDRLADSIRDLFDTLLRAAKVRAVPPIPAPRPSIARRAIWQMRAAINTLADRKARL